MKTLSIRQPWAWAIVTGIKDVENRKWNTKVRGNILVHAGLKVDPYGMKYLASLGVTVPDLLPLGAIVGRVEIVDVVTAMDSKYFFGPYGFVLNDAVEFDSPVACKGKLGFFDTPIKALEGLK